MQQTRLVSTVEHQLGRHSDMLNEPPERLPDDRPTHHHQYHTSTRTYICTYVSKYYLHSPVPTSVFAQRLNTENGTAKVEPAFPFNPSLKAHNSRTHCPDSDGYPPGCGRDPHCLALATKKVEAGFEAIGASDDEENFF